MVPLSDKVPPEKVKLLAKVMTKYQAAVDHTRREHAALWRDDLTLNTAGSPTYKLHESETLSNDISVGTGLLKPSHYDLATLAEHRPAAYIATPVLKATGAVNIPALDDKSKVFSWWDVNQRETYFIYGGYWMADYESPKGLQINTTFGRSSNQEIVNASAAVGLKVDDQVFLRPQQVEGVLLQFGERNPGMARVMVGDALVFEHDRLVVRMNQFFDRIESQLRQSLRSAGDADGSVIVPEVLRPYMRGIEVIGA